MLYLTGNPTDLRNGLSRRDVLRVGLGTGFSGLFLWGKEARSASATVSGSLSTFGRAKSVIILYLYGGPSHIDTFDMKPSTPPEIRGEFSPVSTNVPGVQVCEHLPLLARNMDKVALVRSMTHGDVFHGSSSHAMLTGRLPNRRGEIPPGVDDFPHIGSVISRFKKPARIGVPPFVSLPWNIATFVNVIPGQNGGFLGRAMDPYRLEPPDKEIPTFTPPMAQLPVDISASRMSSRRSLLEQMSDSLNQNPIANEMNALYQRAFGLLTSPDAIQAFNLEQEPPRVRERYGMNLWGQSVLMSRRLVEAGVPAVTVYWPERTDDGAFDNLGIGKRDPVAVPPWDTHGNRIGKSPNFPGLRERLLPPFDSSFTALLEDLTARGLLEQTLVVVMGEFGRSPKINTDAGREHYGNCFSILLAGGGIRGGQVYGSSDKTAAFPSENPVTPGALTATIYHCLGISSETIVHDRLSRPLAISEGQPISALFA